MLEVYTVQLSKAKLLLDGDLEDVRLLNTTVKSGIGVFAPTWDMVMGIKSGTLSEDEYTSLYLDKIQKSKIFDRETWEEHIPWDGKIALACYCREGIFCHRHLLKDVIINRHNNLGQLAVDMGEITGDVT